MNTRTLYAVIGVVALLIIGLLIYNQNQGDVGEQSNSQTNNAAAGDDEVSNANDEPISTSTANNNAPNANANANTGTSGQFTDESDLDSGKVVEISYNGTVYTPSNITIETGDTVVFKNNSTGSFWPASGPHPQHTDYPEFDPKKAIAAGGTFEFKFLKAGEWGFHDHLRPSAFGKITVQ